MVTTDLKSIQTFLEAQEFQCIFMKKTDELPFEHLIIALGADDKGRNLLIQLRIAEEDLEDSYKLFKLHKPKSKHHVLHFFCALPFLIEGAHVADVARFILLINKSSGLPGFEFSEVDRMIYFRNVVMTTSELSEVILMTVIGNIMTYIDTFGQSLEDVGLGTTSLTDVINATKASQ